ncbi:5-formyltetrahydrofolate cyclo-ligase [Persicobacter psychrovividus]|uniref:5-formyltetrahydrofolate cyclo-ligase n=1 Tax=Persicobacter psychrovividus TaxID=387638 RepID=A0ABN6L556_9BACT|nr:5-formyltetrahydrofolate cyclo-ligase [Persicobacter psychrovividus]
MLKKNLRAVYKNKRKALTEEEFTIANTRLTAQFKATINLEKVKKAHCYLPIIRHREIDTWPIIEYLQAQGIAVVIPKSDFSNCSMRHFLLKQEQLKENEWGILEPTEEAREIQPKELDIVIVPLLAFDQQGYRVGYGKGFYDRFLNECNPNIMKIGLSLFLPVENIEDINPFDEPLDQIICPNQIIIPTPKKP